MRKHKKRMRQSTRITYIILSIILLIFSLVSFCSTVFMKKSTVNNKKAYSYDTKFNLEYGVNLKDNEVFEEKTMPMNKSYFTALIDNVDTNIKYNYKASRPNELIYTYSVKGFLTGIYQGRNEEETVIEKEYILLEEKRESVNSDEVNIDENIKIDLKDYIKIIRDIENDFGMEIQTNFKIIFEAQISTTVNEEKVENRYISDVGIDLGKKTTKFIGKLEDSNSKDVLEEISDIKEINIFIVILDIILFSIGLMIIRYIYSKTIIARNLKSKYKVELNKILRLCQDKIVQVSTQVEVNRGEIIDVRDFGELIKLAEEIGKPIICWIDKENDEAHFCVISGGITYKYILKEEKL